MTILALRTSRRANGVSKLHGEVSKGLWKDVWAGVPEDEVPITSITNGIHTKTWAAPEFMDLYTKYLGADWEENLTNVDYWLRVNRIPDEVLWDTHQKLKARLIDFARERVRAQRERLGESPAQLRQVNNILNPEILTIGFARRFATYKRGALLFRQPERLLKLLNDAERPVQFVFAGKAHPKDDGGKKVIQEVYKYTREPGVGEPGRVHRRLRRAHRPASLPGRGPVAQQPVAPPGSQRHERHEAAAQRRAEPERTRRLVVRGLQRQERLAHRRGDSDGSVDFQNEVDIESLFHILETQVVPLYYAKPDGKLPIAWLRLMRESMLSVTPGLQHAPDGHGVPRAALRHGGQGVPRAQRRQPASRRSTLSEWKNRMRRDWQQVHVGDVQLDHARPFPQSRSATALGVADATVHLGPTDADGGDGAGVLRREPGERHQRSRRFWS